ncbi:MAG: DUF3147 family protein [Candidatus Acidiferrum sp.]|jgi:hypothetical protein
MLTEILLRMVMGGVFVTFFACLGDMIKPKSFAGIFSAAPSVALASLALTLRLSGKSYAAIETRSMIAGAIAFLVYSSCVCYVLIRWKLRTLRATLLLLPLWFGAAFGIWAAWLR